MPSLGSILSGYTSSRNFSKLSLPAPKACIRTFFCSCRQSSRKHSHIAAPRQPLPPQSLQTGSRSKSSGSIFSDSRIQSRSRWSDKFSCLSVCIACSGLSLPRKAAA